MTTIRKLILARLASASDFTFADAANRMADRPARKVVFTRFQLAY